MALSMILLFILLSSTKVFGQNHERFPSYFAVRAEDRQGTGRWKGTEVPWTIDHQPVPQDDGEVSGVWYMIAPDPSNPGPYLGGPIRLLTEANFQALSLHYKGRQSLTEDPQKDAIKLNNLIKDISEESHEILTKFKPIGTAKTAGKQWVQGIPNDQLSDRLRWWYCEPIIYPNSNAKSKSSLDCSITFQKPRPYIVTGQKQIVSGQYPQVITYERAWAADVNAQLEPVLRLRQGNQVQGKPNAPVALRDYNGVDNIAPILEFRFDKSVEDLKANFINTENLSIWNQDVKPYLTLPIWKLKDSKRKVDFFACFWPVERAWYLNSYEAQTPNDQLPQALRSCVRIADMVFTKHPLSKRQREASRKGKTINLVEQHYYEPPPEGDLARFSRFANAIGVEEDIWKREHVYRNLFERWAREERVKRKQTESKYLREKHRQALAQLNRMTEPETQQVMQRVISQLKVSDIAMRKTLGLEVKTTKPGKVEGRRRVIKVHEEPPALLIEKKVKSGEGPNDVGSNFQKTSDEFNRADLDVPLGWEVGLSSPSRKNKDQSQTSERGNKEQIIQPPNEFDVDDFFNFNKSPDIDLSEYARREAQNVNADSFDDFIQKFKENEDINAIVAANIKNDEALQKNLFNSEATGSKDPNQASHWSRLTEAFEEDNWELESPGENTLGSPDEWYRFNKPYSE